MDMDLLDFARSMELLVAAAILGLVALRIILSWRDYSVGQKLIFTSWVSFMVVAFWDTWLLLIRHNEYSWRLVPFTLGMGTAFAYLLEPKRSYTKRVGDEDPMEGKK